MAETDLMQLYSRRILALTTAIPHQGRLDDAQASVQRRSPQCGSSVTVHLSMADGRISDFAQEVRACALGQASASVLGQAVIGMDRAGIAQARDHRPQVIVLTGGVEPAFGRPFLALFRHDARRVRAMAQGDGDHLLGRRHLEIQRHLEIPHQTVDVGIDDVAPVLAQMRGDAVGAGRLGQACRPQRVGQMPAARVPHGGDVIDIDAETQMIGRSHTQLSRREVWGAVNCGRVRRR